LARPLAAADESSRLSTDFADFHRLRVCDTISICENLRKSVDRTLFKR
jgi:hypothetical protein